jgi:hypothetical protein
MLSDHDLAFRNGARQLYGEDLPFHMCSFHVTQCLKRTGVTKLVDKDHIKEILEDFRCMYNTTILAIKTYAVKMFLEKWRGLGEDAFADYFESMWAGLSWSRADVGPGVQITNNTLERWNRELKSIVKPVRNLTAAVQAIGGALRTDSDLNGPFENSLPMPRQMWRDAQVELNKGMHLFVYRRAVGDSSMLDELEGDTMEAKKRSMTEWAKSYLTIRANPSSAANDLESLTFDDLQVVCTRARTWTCISTHTRANVNTRVRACVSVV